MKKNIETKIAVFPMPVLMIAAYDENGKVNVMNAAWGMICAEDKIALFIDEDHKTTKNIRAVKAFTVSLANEKNIAEADFFGIATGNKMTDKFERTNFHAIVGKILNAQADEEILDAKGKVIPKKINALIFDQFQNNYYKVGEKVGKAWNAGAKFMKKLNSF